MANENEIRLQKIIAAGGFASRRGSEELISAGRVEVNDEIVTTLGLKINPYKDVVRVDGERVNFQNDLITIALNKPKDVVSAMKDPQSKVTLEDVIGTKYGRLFHIGRLDTDSEGLLLMTNDGDLAQLIAHPSNNIPKTYIATLNGKITDYHIKSLLKGVELEDGLAKFDKARILGSSQSAQESLVECTLHSGKNRIVRRMFDNIGFKVVRLIRVQIGPIKLGELKPGKTRVLSEVEISAIEMLAKKGKKTNQFDISKKNKERSYNKVRNKSK